MILEILTDFKFCYKISRMILFEFGFIWKTIKNFGGIFRLFIIMIIFISIISKSSMQDTCIIIATYLHNPIPLYSGPLP